jgi:hypothetical protein
MSFLPLLVFFTNNEPPFVLFLNLKHVERFHIKLLTHNLLLKNINKS